MSFSYNSVNMVICFSEVVCRVVGFLVGYNLVVFYYVINYNGWVEVENFVCFINNVFEFKVNLIVNIGKVK